MARSLFLVTLVWVVIYLPRLGTLELKSEEGRRVLPAVTMLETGNYIVPQVGSEPYLRKPPLVNWLVAASFKLSGTRNEWMARLPSVVAVLVVALAFIAIAQRALGPNGSLAAAMMWLTNFGLLEKGRMIEIEALYVSLTALAFVVWLSWWNQPNRRWLAWVGAGFFLGLALLAKGPLALLFFYAVVLAVLWQAREMRQLSSPPHLLGIILMLGIFAAWAIPYLRMTEAGHAAGVWSRQFSGRLSGEEFKFGDWLLNLPRGFAYLLPWSALFLFTRFRLLESPEEKSFARALSLGVGLSFVLIGLVPGALPRYLMPLLAPAIWLLALFIRGHALVWPKPLRRVITWTIVTIACAMLIYSFAIIPVLQRREKIRPIARALEALIPPNEILYAVDPEYQPYLFYFRKDREPSPIRYVSQVSDLPQSARFILVQPENEKTMEQNSTWNPLHPQVIQQIKDYRGRRVTLFEIKGPD
jgi:4-amino-4-deoxy-L-arabinose transferase-like glycosyltransferase